MSSSSSSSSLKVTLLLLIATFFAVAIAVDITIASADDQYCDDLLARGGCAQCEASPDCSFCAPYDDTYAGVCRAVGNALNCDALVENHGYISAEEANLCPNPIGAGVYQAGIRSELFNPNFHEDVKNANRYTTFNDGFYCDIGLARPYDRLSHKAFHSANPATNDDLCGVVNHQFGYAFEACRCCCCDGAQHKFFDMLVPRKAITTAEELVAEVMENCHGAVKRDPGLMNPYSTEDTLECIKLMQQAYCSVGCPSYDTPQGKICRTGTEIDELYRLCAPYTSGPNEEARTNCPLDPNGLPLTEVDGEDTFAPSFCDENLQNIHESDRFSDDFKLYDGVIPEADEDFEDTFESCGDTCSELCGGNYCNNIAAGFCTNLPH